MAFASAIALAAGAGGVSAALAETGAVAPPDPPEADDVRCLRDCASLRGATVGSRVEVTGRRLENVEGVIFPGEESRWVRSRPDRVSRSSVLATVPDGAATGRVVVRDFAGQWSRTAESLEIVDRSQISAPEQFELSDGSARPSNAFFAGRRPRLDYLFRSDRPSTDVRVDVIRRKTGEVVRSFLQEDRRRSRTHYARWSGRQSGGRVARNGGYRFRVGPADSARGSSTRSMRFNFFTHKFPLRGRHSYGDGLGAGRGHQGQDVFGRCGARVVAARGGRIQYRGYHYAAGYYIVVDGFRTNLDYVYMHLARRRPVREGDRIRTGQVLGYNSDTGNASGCHLHFELWRGGWYESGGRVVDPTRKLRRWDRWS